jgi:hypothetical protein
MLAYAYTQEQQQQQQQTLKIIYKLNMMISAVVLIGNFKYECNLEIIRMSKSENEMNEMKLEMESKNGKKLKL